MYMFSCDTPRVLDGLAADGLVLLFLLRQPQAIILDRRLYGGLAGSAGDAGKEQIHGCNSLSIGCHLTDWQLERLVSPPAWAANSVKV
jgi:hypothetical protein